MRRDKAVTQVEVKSVDRDSVFGTLVEEKKNLIEDVNHAIERFFDVTGIPTTSVDFRIKRTGGKILFSMDLKL